MTARTIAEIIRHNRMTLMLRPTVGVLGAELRAVRDRHDLSQRDVAARCGIDHSTITRIERGSRDPSPATLARLADALDADPAERDALWSALRLRAEARMPPPLSLIGRHATQRIGVGNGEHEK